MSETRPKRVQRFGPELWQQRAGQDWSLWDLWFCVIAESEHGGDLDAVADTFIEVIRAPGSFGGRDGEAKLSHIWDLRDRLAAAGVTPSELAGGDVLADKKVLRRAREKVSGRLGLEDRACTPAMIDTPRRRLRHRARYGHWSGFPADPGRFFEKFRPTVDRKHHVSKGRTFAIVSRLQKRLADLDGPRRDVPDRLALYRAFHTAGLELADACDDSYGNIGEARTGAWHTYLSIDWRGTGMDPAAYWQDLCELRIWEPYGLDYNAEEAWFASASRDDITTIESILLALDDECRGLVLDWEADEALQALADLYVATGARDRYVMAARRLGSRWWRPIEAMAKSQLEANDVAGAVAVFSAADQPGWHQDHLRQRCRALTGISLDTDESHP